MAQGEDFGSLDEGKKKKVQIEFVSANPTGPLSIAHGRQAAVGDALAHILEFCGYQVVREYYLNDEGTQIELLGESLRMRYAELAGIQGTIPENGYKGSYLIDIARVLFEKHGESLLKKDASTIKAFFEEAAVKVVLEGIKKDLDDFGVSFDIWFSQKAMTKRKEVEKVLALLKEKGFTYEKEGALWFKSTAFGDDKDRVLIKSDGNYTYISPDIAYHFDKFSRGFTKVVNIWGPDHHGYIPRIKAACEALGFGKDRLEVLIVQLSTLYKQGKVVSMSTRQGEFITLRELMDEVGRDAARFFFCLRRINSHLDFDLDVAKKQSPENPVYYIQYAHARTCGIIKNYCASCGKKSLKKLPPFSAAHLREAEEKTLLRYLGRFPSVVATAHQQLEPYCVITYLQELATVFHKFYDVHKVVGTPEDLMHARLALVSAAKIVLANGLRLLGVSQPEAM